MSRLQGHFGAGISGIVDKGNTSDLWRDLLEQIEPLRAERRLQIRETRYVAAGMLEARHKTLRHRLAHPDEYDRHSRSRRLDLAQTSAAVDRYHVRHPLRQVLCNAAGPLAVQHSPEIIDAYIAIAAGHPPGIFQSLSERIGAQLSLRVALNVLHHHRDPPQPLALLRARRERPRRCTAKESDELAAFHCPASVLTYR